MNLHVPLPLRILVLPLLAASLVAQVNWSQLSGSGAPMAYGASAWDAARSRLVAFGGEQGIAQTDATREFNPATSQWSLQNPAVRPSARRRPAMAYDEARGECVLFGGGAGASTFLADTWTWNGTTWSQKAPVQSPSPRFGAAMAYDSARQVVVLFGGFVASGLDIADVWEWDGANWTPRPFAGSGPGARGAHRLAYDEARAVTVLHGGYNTPTQSTLADTWTWNGSSWSAGPSGPNSPGSLCDQLFVYDRHRQRIVSFGGLRITGPTQLDLNQTWEWDGASWLQRTTATTPSARSAMACGFAPGAPGRVISAGGATNSGTQFGTTFAMAPTTPATVTSFGTGCPTTAGAVQLNAVSMPYAGSTFVHEIAGGPALSFVGILAFGGSNTNWNGLPLPLDLTVVGAPGCQALVSLDVLVTVLLTNGAGSAAWALPNQASLVGQGFFTQGVVLDPLSPLPFQIGASSGRQWTIGSL